MYFCIATYLNKILFKPNTCLGTSCHGSVWSVASCSQTGIYTLFPPRDFNHVCCCQSRRLSWGNRCVDTPACCIRHFYKWKKKHSWLPVCFRRRENPSKCGSTLCFKDSFRYRRYLKSAKGTYSLGLTLHSFISLYIGTYLQRSCSSPNVLISLEMPPAVNIRKKFEIQRLCQTFCLILVWEEKQHQ